MQRLTPAENAPLLKSSKGGRPFTIASYKKIKKLKFQRSLHVIRRRDIRSSASLRLLKPNTLPCWDIASGNFGNALLNASSLLQFIHILFPCWVEIFGTKSKRANLLCETMNGLQVAYQVFFSSGLPLNLNLRRYAMWAAWATHLDRFTEATEWNCE